jgi:hypothetical protein
MVPHHRLRGREKQRSEGKPTPSQLRWLSENPAYQVVAADCRYEDLGLVTVAGRFYGGTFPIPPVGSIAVGIPILTAQQKKAARVNRWLAKIRSDPIAWAAFRDHQNVLQRARRAQVAANPVARAREAARRRARRKLHMADPQARERERERGREKQRKKRAALKAAKKNKQSSFATGVAHGARV